MTAPTLDRPTAGRDAQAPRAFAEQVQADLSRNAETVVTVDGYGAGWYVLAVDWGRELFEVRRSGAPISVPWRAVQQAR